MKGHHDLRLVAAIATVCAIGVLITPLGAVRVVFALPLALFLTGYAVSSAALAPRELTPGTMLPLSLGLSLAVLALGSVVLNFTPGGIQGLPWSILLLAIVLVGCAVASARRGYAVDSVTIHLRLPNFAASLLIAGAVLAGVVALIVAHTTVKADGAFGYGELWMIPAKQTPAMARVGVKSQLQHDATFRLVLKFGDRRQPEVRSFGLEPGQSRSFHFAHVPRGELVPVRARLFLAGRPHIVYRMVSGWLPARAG